jgi:hypothetical protein
VIAAAAMIRFGRPNLRKPESRISALSCQNAAEDRYFFTEISVYLRFSWPVIALVRSWSQKPER